MSIKSEHSVQAVSRRLTSREENRLNEAAKVRIATLLGVKRNMIDLTDEEPPRKTARRDGTHCAKEQVDRAQVTTRSQEESTVLSHHPSQGPSLFQNISPPSHAPSTLQHPTAVPHDGIPGSSSYQGEAQTQSHSPLVSQHMQPVHPTELLSRISTSVASLKTPQLQDILSTVVLRYPDVLELVQKSPSRRGTHKPRTQGELYDLLLAQSQEQAAFVRHQPPPSLPSQQRTISLLPQQYSQRQPPTEHFRQHFHPRQMAYPQMACTQTAYPQTIPVPQVVPIPQQEPPVDFSDKIYRVTNFLYNKWGGKEAHLDHTGDATEAIQAEIRKIARKVDRDSASSTKYSALETLARIGYEVATADGGYLVVAVRDRMHDEDEFLVNSCWKVYKKMTRTEKLGVCHPRRLKESLQSLEDSRGGCFDGFGSFLEQFEKTSVPGPHGEEDDEEEEEESDEDVDDMFDDDSPEKISEEEGYGPWESEEDMEEDEDEGSENSY